MTILLKPTRLDNTPADRPGLEPVTIWIDGDPPGPGETIPPRPLRLSPAEAAELNRVGYYGDAPVVGPIRSGDAYEPAVVEARISGLAAELAAEYGMDSGRFGWGAYRAEYRHLWAMLLEARAEIERMRPYYYPMGDEDEPPQLDESAYFDPADLGPALTDFRL